MVVIPSFLTFMSGFTIHTQMKKGLPVRKKAIFGANQVVHDPARTGAFLQLLLKEKPTTHKQIEDGKRAFAKQHGGHIPQNREILTYAEQHKISIPKATRNLLQKRAVRTISGVSPIGILTKPYACPGKCVYCPTEDRMPKSYMSNQPAAARALRNKFHPFRQVRNRLIALEQSGHPTSKLEVIVMGGTWSFLPTRYQSWYVKRCYDAANIYSGAFGAVTQDNKPPAGYHAPTIKDSQTINETAKSRIIGLTLETRPDFINERELRRMRNYGCTRIEIGVQTLDDDISRLTKRGHYVSHVKKAMRLMKEYGFKVCWHLMPGLPGATPAKDLEMMKEVFTDEDCRPDFIKIYPCVVLNTAELKSWWEEGKYEPYDDATIVRLLMQFKPFIPEYCRVMRLMRDIPVTNILGGAKLSNLRQIINSQPKKLKEVVGEEYWNNTLVPLGYTEKHAPWVCKCVRCREVGFSKKTLTEPVLTRRDYKASGGDEVFLSFESADKSTIYALLRLRKPDESFEPKYFKRVLKGAALIREVHSYGGEVSVGDAKGIGQHRGLGKRLIAEAERIATEEWGLGRMTIIAGVGTREYYRKWGYELQSTYMTKKLS